MINIRIKNRELKKPNILSEKGPERRPFLLWKSVPKKDLLFMVIFLSRKLSRTVCLQDQNKLEPENFLDSLLDRSSTAQLTTLLKRLTAVENPKSAFSKPTL